MSSGQVLSQESQALNLVQVTAVKYLVVVELLSNPSSHWMRGLRS